ncbi:MAG TPA: hypothetical protein PKC76_11245 [Saprospiraceae bacterium]|nr:hypothetical protein [Saprospiraceae bacterium]HMP24701.1 hypothetical protein [Saprospiraceae bacterium]
MKLIQDNPYRIAGILANASEREVVRQKGKITRYAPIGKQVKSEFDFSFLPNVDRTDANAVNKAFSGIEQNQDKVSQSLFWFLKVNPFDETAITHLINGDKDKAIEIWEKVTDGKEVNSKNYSCFNNVGTLKLLGNSKEEIKAGIEAKIKLIESTSFANFVHTVADQTYTIDNQKQAEKFVDDLLKQFKGKYSNTDTLKLFSNCNGTTQKYLSQKFTEEPLHKIETQIESTKNKRKFNKSGAYEFGVKLFESCKADLATLKSLLGTSDLKYKMIADNLAKEVMQCGIEYFKELQEKKDPTEEGLELLNYAKSIAIGSQTLERIKSNIEAIEEFKDKEISQAIALLKSVKDAYETNEAQIKTQVRIQEASLSYGQSINWSKVNTLIRNSINWDKVVELILNVIPRQSIDKIKNNQNASKTSNYKKLVEFIIDKLNYSQKSKIQYLQYWETVQTTRSTSIPTSRTTTSSTYSSSSSSSGSEVPWLKIIGWGIFIIILIRACAE